MAKYIVQKKGLFGTLYVETGNYNKYQSTVKDINKAMKFDTLAEAKRAAKAIKGDIIEVKEDTDKITDYDLVHCKHCSYYDGINCRRTNMPSDPMDFCSRGLTKNI